MSESVRWDWDFSTVRHQEAILRAAARAQVEGLRPAMFRLHPDAYAWLEGSLDYLHEYIDEEERSFLVMRVPSRLLVTTDISLKEHIGVLVCRSPDREFRVCLAN